MQAYDAHVRLTENAAHELVRTKACKSVSVRKAPPLPILAHRSAWHQAAPIKIQKPTIHNLLAASPLQNHPLDSRKRQCFLVAKIISRYSCT